ncbi:MAG: response regulator [Spirochaetaceae bacterium]|nr:response regulator [Spirochaetaceae bacterium]
MGTADRTIKILIVDDSRIMQNILKNSFDEKEAWGKTEFLTASDGEEALVVMDENTIDVLLLDWNMPKLDGLSVLKKLRQTDKYKKLPVIMITSEAAKYNVIEALKAGVSDYIIKPASRKILIDKVKGFILGES